MTRSKLQQIALIVLLALGAYLIFAPKGDTTGGQARELVAAGARLVDVRSPGEFAAGHLPGAVNIPVDEIDGRLGELEPKDAPVVVYCRSGARSSSAARALEGAGFSKVHNLGAMSSW